MRLDGDSSEDFLGFKCACVYPQQPAGIQLDGRVIRDENLVTEMFPQNGKCIAQRGARLGVWGITQKECRNFLAWLRVGVKSEVSKEGFNFARGQTDWM